MKEIELLIVMKDNEWIVATFCRRKDQRALRRVRFVEEGADDASAQQRFNRHKVFFKINQGHANSRDRD